MRLVWNGGGGMKFVFASDSFKGSLSSEQIAVLLTEAAKQVFPDCECCGISVADGGEGTVEAVIKAVSGTIIPVTVHDPLMKETASFYGRIDETRAIVAVANTSGLPMVPMDQRNPLFTTSYGMGELIVAALDAGYRNISIALGGSATNDGGMGCMCALGVRFLDRNGKVLSGIGANLRNVTEIDMSGLHPAVKEAKFTLMCDVEAPLCGKDGATYAFGRQKGGSRQILEELERGMQNYAERLNMLFGCEINSVSCGGAAGGLGAALYLFLHAERKKGIDTILDLIGFDELISDADCVITGEGKVDRMTAFGKVMSGVGRRCRQRGVPAIAIVGGMGEQAEEIYACGIDSMVTTVNHTMPMKQAMDHAVELYRCAAYRTMQLLRTGYRLRQREEQKGKA